MNLLLSDPAFLSAISVEAAPPPAGLLLDTYTGAAAAYSLRQLRTGVTNVVRVRRSSDNTEQDFTATQVDDGTLTAFCGSGDGFVRTWYDQSGNDRHAVQNLAANQPYLVSQGVIQRLNGKPAIWSGPQQARLLPTPSIGLLNNINNHFVLATETNLQSDPRGCMLSSGTSIFAGVFDPNSTASTSTTGSVFWNGSQVNLNRAEFHALVYQQKGVFSWLVNISAGTVSYSVSQRFYPSASFYDDATYPEFIWHQNITPTQHSDMVSSIRSYYSI